jgi:hypothetical protein
VLQRRLRRDEYAADVDVDHAIHLFQSRFLERFWNGRAGIVHQNIQLAEGGDDLFDRGLDGVRIGGIRLDCDRLSALAFNLLNHRRGCIGSFRVGDGYIRPVRGQAFGDGGTNAAGAARNKCNFSFQFPVHDLSLSFKVDFFLYRLV